jgi:hypothetical protein
VQRTRGLGVAQKKKQPGAGRLFVARMISAANKCEMTLQCGAVVFAARV